MVFQRVSCFNLKTLCAEGRRFSTQSIPIELKKKEEILAIDNIVYLYVKAHFGSRQLKNYFLK